MDNHSLAGSHEIVVGKNVNHNKRAVCKFYLTVNPRETIMAVLTPKSGIINTLE